MAQLRLTSLGDAYPRELPGALAMLGDYVYAYYRPDELQPFYVGKGNKSRVLAHWNAARANGNKPHEQEIRAILRSGRIPIVKLLAYNLEATQPPNVNATVERVLQDAFGIQKVVEKKPGTERLVPQKAVLLQTREDSARTPVLTLDAALARSALRPKCSLQEIADMLSAPVLLVGISQTYHPKYSPEQLGEMARMYWMLDRYANTTLPAFKSASDSVLLAWSSMLSGAPTIVGAWRVQSRSMRTVQTGRRILKLVDQVDLGLRKACIGLRLPGKGNNWQGPRIAIPADQKEVKL